MTNRRALKINTSLRTLGIVLGREHALVESWLQQKSGASQKRGETRKGLPKREGEKNV